MKFSHRCILIAGAMIWFLLFWNLPEYHAFKNTSALLIKITSVLAAVLLIYYALTATAKDASPILYSNEDEEEEEQKKEEEKDNSS